MDFITCPRCEEEYLDKDFSQTRCGHAICTNCVDYDVAYKCYTCGITLVELMDFPELSVLKDTCGDLIHNLVSYKSISKAHISESHNDAYIYLQSTSILNSVFSKMIVKGEEPEESEKGLMRVLLEELKEIESLLDSKYTKPGPKSARR